MESYKTKGTCSTRILFDVEEDIIKQVKFENGCSGNLRGISALVEGMRVEDVIKKFKGIPCRGETSCPDQLARALEEFVQRLKIK